MAGPPPGSMEHLDEDRHHDPDQGNLQTEHRQNDTPDLSAYGGDFSSHASDFRPELAPEGCHLLADLRELGPEEIAGRQGRWPRR
jgi:hypothetical protein